MLWRPLVGTAITGNPESETYGTTSTCTFTGNALKRQVVVLTVARPAPKVASSDAFAERRIEQGKRTPDLATNAEPVEGLGAPAIRSDDGSGPATIEAVTGGRSLGVTAGRVVRRYPAARVVPGDFGLRHLNLAGTLRLLTRHDPAGGDPLSLPHGDADLRDAYAPPFAGSMRARTYPAALTPAIRADVQR